VKALKLLKKFPKEQKVINALKVRDELRTLDNGGFAPDVLEAALFWVKNTSNFRDALENSLAFAGKANYCPVLVGAIAGAMYGFSNIEMSKCQHCNSNLRERIGIASQALAELWK